MGGLFHGGRLVPPTDVVDHCDTHLGLSDREKNGPVGHPKST